VLKTLILLLLSGGVAFADSDDLTLHDPTFYRILSRVGSHLECRYSQSGTVYGFDLDRKPDELVHVTVITAGKSEGEKTAFDAKIESQDFLETYLKFYKRDGDMGSYIEMKIESQVAAEFQYRLPAKVMFTSATYSKETDGQEAEDLEPESMHPMGCAVPFFERTAAEAVYK
jgi:hypothetical protein